MSTEMTNAPTEGRGAVENLAGFARQRTAAALRLEPLYCGHRDPWLCDCQRSTYIRPEARLAAAQHLAAAGLAPRKWAA